MVGKRGLTTLKFKTSAGHRQVAPRSLSHTVLQDFRQAKAECAEMPPALHTGQLQAQLTTERQ